MSQFISQWIGLFYSNYIKKLSIRTRNHTIPQTVTTTTKANQEAKLKREIKHKRQLKYHIKAKRFPKHHRQRAFSLIEVTIVIAILSILLSVALPNFNSIIEKSTLSKTSLDLISSLSLARQYAITSNDKVHLCALTSIEPVICQKERPFNANWSQGWMVFADINGNNEYDQSDAVLSVSSQPKTINIVFNQQGRLRFFPDGSARSAGFYICSKNSSNNRHIKLLYSGRARATKISKPSQLTACLSVN